MYFFYFLFVLTAFISVVLLLFFLLIDIFINFRNQIIQPCEEIEIFEEHIVCQCYSTGSLSVILLEKNIELVSIYICMTFFILILIFYVIMKFFL